MVSLGGFRDNFVDGVRARRCGAGWRRISAEADRQPARSGWPATSSSASNSSRQLVHGRTDPALRSGDHVTVSPPSRAGRLCGPAKGRQRPRLRHHRLLRTLEHPDPVAAPPPHASHADGEGRPAGSAEPSAHRKDPVTAVRAGVASRGREVRRLHEWLFYRPLLHAPSPGFGADDVRFHPTRPGTAASARLPRL